METPVLQKPWERGNHMRKLMLASAALMAATAITAPANAAVQVDFFQGVQVSNVIGFQSIVYNFNTPAGTPTLVGSGAGYVIQSNGDSEGAVIPFPDSAGSKYLSVLGNGQVEIDLPNLSGFAFEWGSLDSYNKLIIATLSNGTTQLIPGTTYLGDTGSNGDQLSPLTNGTLRVLGTNGEIFTKLTLISTSNSFEIDNIAFAAIPEASTWAMMMIGLGAVGYSMRRRKVAVSFA